MSRLNGKVALVTGGSRGIGTGIDEKLAHQGVSAAFTYVNAAEKAIRLQSGLSAQGGNIVSIKPIRAEHMNRSMLFSWL